MIDIGDIHSLSDFQRNAKARIRQLRRTGRPTVLTVNGRASVVVQDAQSFKQLLDAVEDAETHKAALEGLRQLRKGQTIPFEKFDARMRRKLKLPPRKPA